MKIHILNKGIAIEGEYGTEEVSRYLSTYPLIIQDPPYGNIVTDEWDHYSEAHLTRELVRWLQTSENHLEPGGSVYVWGGIGKPLDRPFFRFILQAEHETNLRMRNLITWSKKRAYGKPDDYLFTREECAWFTTKPRTFYKPLLTELRGYPGYNAKYPAKSPHKRRTNVWTDITEILRGKLHRCHKPEKLAQVMIETHTESGETILEPFAGSGSASVAAIRSGRRYVAIEKDSQTFECLLERLKVEENRR